MQFPDIDPSSFKFKTKKDIFTCEYNGYTQSKPKYTRAIKIFTFQFVSLTQAQADLIDDFLVNTRGDSFIFVHPMKETLHEVRLLEDLPEFTWEEGNYYQSTDIVLEEV